MKGGITLQEKPIKVKGKRKAPRVRGLWSWGGRQGVRPTKPLKRGLQGTWSGVKLATIPHHWIQLNAPWAEVSSQPAQELEKTSVPGAIVAHGFVQLVRSPIGPGALLVACKLSFQGDQQHCGRATGPSPSFKSQ